MLASVCSYRVMVKSVSSCCVRGRWVLSNPVTYIAFEAKVYLCYCCMLYLVIAVYQLVNDQQFLKYRQKLVLLYDYIHYNVKINVLSA